MEINTYEFMKESVEKEVIDMLKSKYKKIVVDFNSNTITVSDPLSKSIAENLKGSFVIEGEEAKVEITDGEKIARTIFINKMFDFVDYDLDVEKRVVFFSKNNEKLLSGAIVLETHTLKDKNGFEHSKEEALFTGESLFGKDCPKNLNAYMVMDRLYNVGFRDLINEHSAQSYHAASRLYDDTILLTRGIGENQKLAQVTYSSDKKRLKPDDPSYDEYFFNKKNII